MGNTKLPYFKLLKKSRLCVLKLEKNSRRCLTKKKKWWGAKFNAYQVENTKKNKLIFFIFRTYYSTNILFDIWCSKKSYTFPLFHKMNKDPLFAHNLASRVLHHENNLKQHKKLKNKMTVCSFTCKRFFSLYCFCDGGFRFFFFGDGAKKTKKKTNAAIVHLVQ